MIGKVIGIISFVIEKYERIKEFVKTKYRAHRSRKIRNAVDKRNTSAIRRILQNIKDRRRERRDAS
jgi:hypothetical protein